MTRTFDMDAPMAHSTGAETREGGHVMMMHFNIGLPLGEMLFKNWVVEDETDLAWVSLKIIIPHSNTTSKKSERVKINIYYSDLYCIGRCLLCLRGT